ncbi:ML domain-containing protein [Pseudomassariella vexata]|uniref:Phosphatidylglycerol/phosphatidylinositol transfer protein n=1 Tax=Pseudomassariella vexata TaxID=1141098 RepID=A0A1Y2E125_9PEZI|nr:ML domain-containing protein [Pseudomassariella vexata]ORY65238.1 ML domain-domain-containing protein [Pseudomassariella vexata]
MKFNFACAAALSAAGFASALPSWFAESQDVTTFDDATPVPGKNPLVFCKDHDLQKDIVSITNVDLTPNPPESGAQLAIQATGIIHEPIQEGAYIQVTVKYGLIRLVNTKADLCEQTEKADLKCPIEKGILSVTKEVDIPKEVPPGKYTVHAEVFNADDKPITCLDATVTFGGHAADSEL